jgi:NDP-sugar pyrophosphorylase family protein
MIQLSDYTTGWPLLFDNMRHDPPWEIISSLHETIAGRIAELSGDFNIRGNIAIHRTAVVEEHVILKGPVIISKGCFVAALAYLRNGVYLGDGVSVGPGCEVKNSLILSGSTLAHFNFVGDSILGSNVNMEAGSVIANHYNEREDKEVIVIVDGKPFRTGVKKFGALVGDNSRIGANSVLSPGTLLRISSIVARLELVDQSARA